MSAGLLYGLLRPIGQPGPIGQRWFSRLARFRFADGRVRSFGRYPIALEKGVDLEGHTVPVRLFVGFDRTLLNLLLAPYGRILPRLSPEALRRLCARMLPEVPASPVVWALHRLLESRDAPPPGARPLEQLVEPDVARDWLRTHGYRVVERGVL